jgi:hypothetical protein
MFYCSDNLTTRPYGSSPVGYLGVVDAKLQQLGTRMQLVKISEIKNISNSMAKIAYPGSDEITRFVNIGVDERSLVIHVLKSGTVPCKRKRDRGNKTAVIKRISLGYGQPQGNNCEDSMYWNGTCLPYLDKKRLSKLSLELKVQVGKVMS